MYSFNDFYSFNDVVLRRFTEYQRVFASGGIEGLIAEREQQADRLERG